MNRPYPTTPLLLTPHVGGSMYKNPSPPISKSSFASTFDGSACTDAEPERWIKSWDGYREIEKFGNRHAKFIDSEWLEVHWDEHNATSFPVGTINHLAKWGNEKTGINENVLKIIGWGALTVIGIKLMQKL